MGVRSSRCVSLGDLPRLARLRSFQDFQVPARFWPRDIVRSGLRGLGYCVLELDACWLPFVSSIHHCLWPQVALKGETLGPIKGNLPADSERLACARFSSHQCPAQGIPGPLGLCAYAPPPTPASVPFTVVRGYLFCVYDATKSRRFE